MADIAAKVLDGDRAALSRLITRIENNSPNHQEVLDQLYPHTGQAHIIGVTGPSGSGKSTLVNRLALHMAGGSKCRSSHKIGIIPVDPTSPFTGGALLGDRVRMRDLAANPDIFIRSMASRGAFGGIASAVDGAVMAMDAAGFDTVIIETVGAGQSEVEIARLAHTTVVVTAPGFGDDIQAGKAGILEIADVLVVNKSDQAAADSTAHVLESMLEVGSDLRGELEAKQTERWKVPLVKTSALHGDGISELADTVGAHRDFLFNSGGWQTRSEARLKDLLIRLVKEELYVSWNTPVNREKMEKILQLLAERTISPFQALRDLSR